MTNTTGPHLLMMEKLPPTPSVNGPPNLLFPTRTVKAPEGCPQTLPFLAGRN